LHKNPFFRSGQFAVTPAQVSPLRYCLTSPAGPLRNESIRRSTGQRKPPESRPLPYLSTFGSLAMEAAICSSVGISSVISPSLYFW